MSPRFVAPLLLSCAALVSAWSAAGPSLDSPFLPPAGSSSSLTSANPSDYEWVGVLQAEGEPRFGILRKSDQKTFWLQPGQTLEGVTWLRREAVDRIVVTQGGNEFPLRLREGSLARGGVTAPVSQPMPAPIPNPPPTVMANIPPSAYPNKAPVAPPDPATLAKEREARMLVSDLLEIGMQQRKAYEEAQKRKLHEVTSGARPNGDRP